MSDNHAYMHPEPSGRSRGLTQDEFSDWFRQNYGWWLEDEPVRPLDVIDMRLAWAHNKWPGMSIADNEVNK